MTKEQAEKIYNLVQNGHRAYMDHPYYVADFAKVWKDENGVIMIESNLYSERPLEKYELFEVEVYSRVKIG